MFCFPQKSYETLTNERIQYAPDGSSYVTHQMVMEKAYVEELLGVFAETWERKLSLTSAVMASKLAPVAGGASIDDKNDERQPSCERHIEIEDDVVNAVERRRGYHRRMEGYGRFRAAEDEPAATGARDVRGVAGGQGFRKNEETKFSRPASSRSLRERNSRRALPMGVPKWVPSWVPRRTQLCISTRCPVRCPRGPPRC